MVFSFAFFKKKWNPDGKVSTRNSEESCVHALTPISALLCNRRKRRARVGTGKVAGDEGRSCFHRGETPGPPGRGFEGDGGTSGSPPFAERLQNGYLGAPCVSLSSSPSQVGGPLLGSGRQSSFGGNVRSP